MRSTNNPQAFEAYLEGERKFSIVSQSDMTESQKKFAEATALDDQYARAWGWRAYTLTRSIAMGWEDESRITEAKEWAEKAVGLDDDDYATHWDLAFVLLYEGEFDGALLSYMKALDLYENRTDHLDRKHGLLAELAEAYIYTGEPGKAIAYLERAKRVPDWYKWNLAWADFNNEDYQAAHNELDSMASQPGDRAYVPDVDLLRAATLVKLGDTAEAKRVLGDFLAAQPGYSEKDVNKRAQFRRASDRQRWIDALRAAGLPSPKNA